MFDAKTCIYNGNCSIQSDTPHLCNEGCPRFLEVSYQLKVSGIPKAMQKPMPLTPEKIDRPAFVELKDIRDNITQFVDEGKNLYIFSTMPGNGKTSWSVKILVSYLNQNWLGAGRRDLIRFVNVASLLAKLKAFSEHDDDWKEEKKKILSVPLVVFDDIGSSKLSDFDHANLFYFIDDRINNGRSCIFTSNLGEEALKQVIGERLFSRVWNTSRKVEFKGQDRRTL